MASKQRRLAKARKQRSLAGRSIAQLKAGQVSVRELLTHPPRALSPVRVYTLLLATPHLGESGMRRVLEAANVWPTVRMGVLTVEQRIAIRDALPPRVK